MTLLVPHSPGVPEPSPTSVSRPFWDGCRRGVLLYQRCANGHAVFNPAARCRICLSDDLTWTESQGIGTVYTWSVVWRPQTPDFATPYAPVVVDLDEGYQMISSIVGCDHGDVRVGLRVGVEFHPIGGGFTLPYFSPVGES